MNPSTIQSETEFELEVQAGEKVTEKKYSREVKMKKKIVHMILNAANEYPMSEEDVRRDNETRGILKTIDQQELTKKRMPNQWPDHPRSVPNPRQ